jgi:hypothetical protein
VRDVHIEELVAAAPELLVIEPSGSVLGAPSNNLLEICAKLNLEYMHIIIRQLALDR